VSGHGLGAADQVPDSPGPRGRASVPAEASSCLGPENPRDPQRPLAAHPLGACQAGSRSPQLGPCPRQKPLPTAPPGRPSATRSVLGRDDRISIGGRGAGQAIQCGIRLAPPCPGLEGLAWPARRLPCTSRLPQPRAPGCRGVTPGAAHAGGFPRLPLRMDLGDQPKTAPAPAMLGVAADMIRLGKGVEAVWLCRS